MAVASTKAFVAQVTALYLLGLHLAKVRGTLDDTAIAGYTAELQRVPEQLREVLASGLELKQLAHWMTDVQSVIYLGRHVGFPIALEVR